MKKILTLAGILIFAGTMASAQSEKQCSLQSLRGNYSFSGQGDVYAGINHAVEGDAGTLTFDGDGNFIGQGSFSLNGTAVQTKIVGTYSVNSDCTTTSLFTDDAGVLVHQEGVIVEGEARFIETDRGVVISRVIRRTDQ
jgi:hypothetical protein